MAGTGFGGTMARRLVGGMNSGVLALMKSSALGSRLSGSLVEISYVGRRSGTTFSLPVGYRRTGEDVVIGVSMPDKKTWWRNFLGEGGPITLHLQEGDRAGHAVAARDEHGRVAVTVRLDQAA